MKRLVVTAWVRQFRQVRVKSQQCVICTPELRKAIGRETGKNCQISRQKEPSKAAKAASGVWKVWGTEKKVSCSEIAREMVRAVGKISSSFSVMKRIDQLTGKRRWWFIVKAPEKSLLEVDERWEHKHWHGRSCGRKLVIF